MKKQNHKNIKHEFNPDKTPSWMVSNIIGKLTG